MTGRLVILISLLIVCISASFPHSLFRDTQEPQQTSKILQVDFATLLAAAGVPKRLFPCVEGLLSTGVNAFSTRHLLSDTAKVCSAYRNATNCVKESGCKNTEVFDIATKGIYATCVEKISLMPLVAPCLKKHAEKAFLECDASCKTDETIYQLSTRSEVKKIAEEGGNLLALLEYLGPACDSTICFLSCMQKGLESKCPGTGSGLVDSAVRPFEAVTRYLQTAPKSTVDAVHKRLPVECEPLIDTHYLARLKFFGALPDRKTTKKPSDGL